MTDNALSEAEWWQKREDRIRALQKQAAALARAETHRRTARRYSPAKKRKAQALRAKGLSCAKIGQQLGVCLQTVWTWCGGRRKRR
jgi:hypothetical protein